MAWSAHEVRHDYQRTVAHVHHGDHTHAVSDHDHGGFEEHADDDNGDALLVHDHLAADVLSSMATIADTIAAEQPFFRSEPDAPERRSSGAPSGDPNTLLRPPRTA